MNGDTREECSEGGSSADARLSPQLTSIDNNRAFSFDAIGCEDEAIHHLQNEENPHRLNSPPAVSDDVQEVQEDSPDGASSTASFHETQPLALLLAKHTLRIIAEQCKAVAPVSLYLFFFLLVVLRSPDGSAAPPYLTIIGGLLVLTAGLVLFLEGLQWGLMPLGHTIGRQLPRQLRASFVLAICFLLGVGVTIAEPAISALQAIGSLVAVERAAYLYAVLNQFSFWLILSVAAGVGIAASLGVLRFYRGWQMKPIILITLAPALLLSIVLHFIDGLRPLIGLAWDCGAITTGPVTVPIVLAVGIGVASAKSVFLSKPDGDAVSSSTSEGNTRAEPASEAASKDGDMGGFGIVSLASLFPVITVQLLGLVLYIFVDISTIQDYARDHDDRHRDNDWLEQTPQHEILLSVRALVPLVLFLVLVLRFVLKQPFPRITLFDVLFDHGHSHQEGVDGQANEASENDDDHEDDKKKKKRTKKRGLFGGVKYHQADDVDAEDSHSDGNDDEDDDGESLEMVELGHAPSGWEKKVALDTKEQEESSDDVNKEKKAVAENEDKAKDLADPDDSLELSVPSVPSPEPAANQHLAKGSGQVNLLWLFLLLALVGLMLFNIGLTKGLTLLGSETGYLTPLTFMALPKEHNHHQQGSNNSTAMPGSLDDDQVMQPLYPYALGVFIALAFSFVLGFGATFAEPALRVLGKQAERLSEGRLQAGTLIYSVCVGVGAGITLGIVKITFHIPLLYLILPAYALTVLLTLAAPDELVNVAWDCGGVTTGPVTVPLVLSLGLAFGNAVDATEGFGILTMASVGPIATVLAVGLLVTKLAEPLQRARDWIYARWHMPRLL